MKRCGVRRPEWEHAQTVGNRATMPFIETQFDFRHAPDSALRGIVVCR